MTVRRIAVRQDRTSRATTQQIVLDGVRLIARMQYVHAIERWVLSLSDQSGTTILAGVPIVNGVDLLRPFKHLDLPQGELFAYSIDREPPTLETVDRSAHLLYREDS